MKYTLSTDRGSITLEASSSYDAEQQAKRAGYTVYSSRTAYTHEESNLGNVSYDLMDGGLAVGIGGGLTIDSEGDLGIQVGGVSFDL